MARFARLVVPGALHHVTQRGNRREPTFFSADDHRFYRDRLAEAAARADGEWVERSEMFAGFRGQRSTPSRRISRISELRSSQEPAR
jgi:hypothetical protein